MDDHPDIYADGFSISAGQFGVTLTLRRSEPTGEPGHHEEPSEIVARIRMSQNLAKAIGGALDQIVLMSTQGAGQASVTVKH
jgi:hypothetical protein